MKRPLAYITAAWLGGDSENAELAAQYCRTVYEAGFSPICPPLYLPLFLNDAVPEEHKSGIDMSRDLLRRSHVLVVCGHSMTEAMSMNKFLNNIRSTENPVSGNRKIINTIAVLLLGIALGTFSKFLDFRQAELPSVLMEIDGAFVSRFPRMQITFTTNSTGSANIFNTSFIGSTPFF